MATGHVRADRGNARLTETNGEPESQPIWHICWKQNLDLPIQLRPDSHDGREASRTPVRLSRDNVLSFLSMNLARLPSSATQLSPIRRFLDLVELHG
jgi:hypothetical protein